MSNQDNKMNFMGNEDDPEIINIMEKDKKTKISHTNLNSL
jgi:hypothetical protein